MIDMSYQDLAELFEERYKANVDDFRPICDYFSRIREALLFGRITGI